MIFLGRVSKSERAFGELKLKILPQNCALYLCLKMMSWERPENVARRMSLWDLYKTFLGQFSEDLTL